MIMFRSNSNIYFRSYEQIYSICMQMDPGKAERHLQFVSNCTGGSLIELLGLLFIPCPSFFIKYKLEQIVFQITSETV